MKTIGSLMFLILFTLKKQNYSDAIAMLGKVAGRG